ncbi:cytochrome c oxidase assembly factor COX20 lethal (3) 87Df [Ptiloglossa arizonensis]|uniref:cytochrome c oxidase assembly factor COX20 lethal (3) 87Df n=1 Tax=Ptiloglossa arizonensis TaxID=3350558 RepID=UPI003FA10EFE
MENLEETEEKKKGSFFGFQIIETQCQRDSLLYGISSGVTGGLIGFLFTSHPRKSMYIGMGCYALTTLIYACYCTYGDYKMNIQGRLIQKVIREVSQGNHEKQLNDSDTIKIESA